MKIKANEADRFLARLDPGVPSMLLYGPDQGQVSELALKAVRQVVDDPADPFNVASIGGDELRGNPGWLIEEAQAFSLMGGRRVVRVRLASDGITEIVKRLLKLERQEALVIIEAGDLAARSSLRKLFETAKNAAALPCYLDEARDIGTLVRQMLGEAGFDIDRDALAYLTGRLGANREVTRREIEKLALYMESASDRTVRLGDAEASVGDSSAIGVDDLVHAALLGHSGRAARLLERLLAENEAPVRLTRVIGSTLMRLIGMRVEMHRGRSAAQAIESARPPIFFRVKPAMEQILQQWPLVALQGALAATVAAETAGKTTGMPDRLLLARLVQDLAGKAAAGREQRGGAARINR
ncbi:MAG: DNA polymerase III subunit delta [Geminicoccaceae bacterium]